MCGWGSRLRSRVLGAPESADLEEGVDARLREDGDGALVAQHPAVIVDAAHRVPRVAGLDVEQVLGQRAVEAIGLADDEQRAVGAADRERSAGGGVERAVAAREDEAVAGV